jgi:hypothetical protein
VNELEGHPSAVAAHRTGFGPQTTDFFLGTAISIGLCTFFVSLISYNFVDIDLWHQMALIRESLSAGHLLKTDPYAYTPTIRPWIDHEWGAGAIAYFATLWLGGRAVVLLKFLLAVGTGIVCARCSRLRGADLSLLSVCALLAAPLAYLGFFAALRAQAYSFFLTAVLLMFLELDRRGGRGWMIVWLVIFPLWVNLHGGFVVAIGLMALHAAEEFFRRSPIRHLLLLLGAMALEIFLNPYGTAYFTYLRRALTMARQYAPEWRPVWDLGPAKTVCFVVAIVVAAYAASSVGLRRALGMSVLAATAAEAVFHRKLLPLFAIAWVGYIPVLLGETAFGRWWVQFTRRRVRFMRVAWIAFACICLATAFRQKPWELSVPQPIYPVGPVDYLTRHEFHGNVMVPFRMGAYVSWKLFPAVKVSLDSRYEETYPDPVVERVFHFYEAAPEWRATLDAFPTDLALIPRDAPIAALVAETGWNRIYRDQQFELYARPGQTLPWEDDSSVTFHGVFP